MKSVQYFNFQNSLAALNFYEKHLGATDIQRVGGDHEMFADMPEEYDIDKNFTMNASFKILGETFYCSDTMKKKRLIIVVRLWLSLLIIQMKRTNNKQKLFLIKQ